MYNLAQNVQLNIIIKKCCCGLIVNYYLAPQKILPAKKYESK